MMNRSCLFAILSVSLFGACQATNEGDGEGAPEEAVGQALQAVPSFGSNPGNLRMFEHVPANIPPGAPLVVALHGCTQSADAYTAAGWNELADLWKFYVVYAEQQTSNNQQRCFTWFENGDINRGQ